MADAGQIRGAFPAVWFFYTALKGVRSENEEDCADVIFMKLDDQRKRGAYERPLAVCQAWAQSGGSPERRG